MATAFENFLAIARWKALWRAWCAATKRDSEEQIGIYLFGFSLLVAIIPVVVISVEATNELIPNYFPTIAFGVSTILALFLLKNRGVVGISSRLKWADFSLTHTAVALGCIPVVLLLLFDPTVFADRSEAISEVVVAPSAGEQQSVNYIMLFGSIVFISAWVAVTEEILFRGVLLSALRKVPFSSNKRFVDGVAIILSAALFGLAHVPAWGLLPSLALAGLGCGFGIAFVVTDEQLLPIICYHFLFDLLSLSLALFI